MNVITANRLILAISSFGAILAIHIWLQKEHGFDHGCWGMQDTASPSTSGACNEPALRIMDRAFGLPLPLVGYIFYAGVALSAIVKTVLSRAWAERCHWIAAAASVVAVTYSGYLLYVQAYVARAFCQPCLLSAGLVFILALLHAWQGLKGVVERDHLTVKPHEMLMSVPIMAAALFAFIGAIIFLGRVGTRRLDEGSMARQFEKMLGKSLPLYFDSERLKEFAACRFDHSAPRLRATDWMSDVPTLGTPGKLQIVAFFEPNCPNCRTLFSAVLKVGQRFGDSVSVYIVPVALWDFSVPQLHALEWARDHGKYLDMWKLFLDRQRRGGLDLKGIKASFDELGLDGDELVRRLDEMGARVTACRVRAREAGVRSSPAIYINGGLVATVSLSEDCLARLVERSLRGPAAKRKGDSAVQVLQVSKTPKEE